MCGVGTKTKDMWLMSKRRRCTGSPRSLGPGIQLVPQGLCTIPEYAKKPDNTGERVPLFHVFFPFQRRGESLCGKGCGVSNKLIQ